MKYRLMLILFIAALALVNAPQAFQQLCDDIAVALQALPKIRLESGCATVYAQERRREDYDLPVRDEIHQNYELSPGASVKVSGLNGPVEIETSNSGTAEVYIVRSARNREDLERRKIIIENTPTSLVVRGEKEHGDNFHSEVRERVRLRVPRQIDLTANGMNGQVNVGEIEGSVKLNGINGKVEVQQAIGYSEIFGINGRVVVTLVRLSERGIRVGGVNGGVELRFADELNADLRDRKSVV